MKIKYFSKMQKKLKDIHREVLEVLDGVSAVSPAVSVDDAVGDALHHAVNRVTFVLNKMNLKHKNFSCFYRNTASP